MGNLTKPQKGFLKHTHVFTGYQEGIPYLTAQKGAIDGIGRQHVKLYGFCDICSKKILIAMIHCDENNKLNI